MRALHHLAIDEVGAICPAAGELLEDAEADALAYLDLSHEHHMGYSEFHNAILSCLNKELIRAKQQNRKLELLSDTFAKIEMNLDTDSEEEKAQQRIKDLIATFIEWVTEISDCLNSDAWLRPINPADSYVNFLLSYSHSIIAVG